MKRRIAGTVTLIGCLVGLTLLNAADPPNGKHAPPKDATPAKLVPAVEAKRLSDNVNRGLKWLVGHQLKNGAWGQGRGARARNRKRWAAALR
jgi:hypothetical protein